MGKKIISLLLVMFMAMAPFQAFATDKSDMGSEIVGNTKIVSSQLREYVELGFSVTEEVDELHRVIKTLERSDSRKHRAANVKAEAEAILLILGMRPNSLKILTPEQLEFIAHSPHIQATTSYSKVDLYGNVSHIEPGIAYIEAKRAIQVESNAMERFIQQMSFQTDVTKEVDESMTTRAGGVGEHNDGIMSLMHLVAQNVSNPSRHLFITDALWLAMPFSRRADSVGSVASSIAIDFNSMRALYSYERRTTTSSDTTTTNHSYVATTQHRTNGIYQGAGAIIQLPSNVYMVEPVVNIVSHHNLNAVMIYEALMVHPQLITNFNSIGSYYHNGFGVSFGNPTLSIEIGADGVAASIGLDISLFNPTRRHVSLLISYRP